MTYPYVVREILSRYPHIDPSDISKRLRHSSFVDLSKRYLYFEVPKAACTQMKELLRLQHGAPPIQLFVGKLMETRREMFVHARENVPLPSLVDLDDATQKEVLESDSFFRFTIVRNPYTRLVSAWKNKVVPCEPGCERLYLEIKGRLPDMHAKELIAFDEFVGYLQARGDLSEADPHWRCQVDHLFLEALSFSHVGKVEDMAATLARFQQHLGLAEPFMMGRKNVSAPVGLATYNQDLADKVYSLYQEDFERLGYNRDSWRDGQSAIPTTPKAVIPEARFYDEIIERNLIISGLYVERERLRADLKRVSRLHLLPLVNALASFRRRIVSYEGDERSHTILDDHLMARLSQKLDVILKLIKGDFVYLDYPVYGNVGDLMIWAGTCALFERHRRKPLGQYSRQNIGKGARKNLEKCQTICFGGGGNFGDLWPDHQKLREEVIAAYPNKRIIVFPQSVHFGSKDVLQKSCEIMKRHPDLHIFVRDRNSLAILQEQGIPNLHLCLDMAHALWGFLRAPKATQEAPLYLLRRDKEEGHLPASARRSNSIDWDNLFEGPTAVAFEFGRHVIWRDAVCGNALPASAVWAFVSRMIIRRAVSLFAPHSTIVTNRLHGVILAALLGRKVIAYDNSYGKISSYIDCWLRDIPNVEFFRDL